MERRREPRIRTLKAARILFNDHRSAITCTVRNLSAGGACLAVASMVGIPKQFDMIIDSDSDKSIRPCRVVWHGDAKLGVQFAQADAAPLTMCA